jgi:hypothetical protein
MQGRQTALCVLKTPQIQQYHIRKQVLRPSSGGARHKLGSLVCISDAVKPTRSCITIRRLTIKRDFFFIMHRNYCLATAPCARAQIRTHAANTKNSLANQVLPKITRLHDALSAIVYRRRCFLCVDIFFVQKKIARPRRALCVWSFVCDIHSIHERNPKVRALGMVYIK